MESCYICSCVFFTTEITDYSPQPIYGVTDVHRFTGSLIVMIDRDKTFCGELGRREMLHSSLIATKAGSHIYKFAYSFDTTQMSSRFLCKFMNDLLSFISVRLNVRSLLY